MYPLSLLAVSLSFGDVISNIPHDGPAIVVYLMVALFIGAIVMGSRKKSPDGKPEIKS